MRKIVATLGVFLISCAFMTSFAVTQEEKQAPTGPKAAVPPDTPDALKAAARPLQVASAGGEVYIGGRGGYYVGKTSRCIIQDYASPPRGYANSLTYHGGNASWWVFQLDGFTFYFAIPRPSSGGHDLLFWTGTQWAHWDTVTYSPNHGNGN